MTAMPPREDTVTSRDRESSIDNLDILFQSLPSFESPGYLEHLKKATAGALPASVLARAQWHLQTGSTAERSVKNAVIGSTRTFDRMYEVLTHAIFCVWRQEFQPTAEARR
jgi:hypothetical protein